jgi:bacteriorhodopsin
VPLTRFFFDQRTQFKQLLEDTTMENAMSTISVEGFEIVNHVLTLGYATMAAALLFFVLTRKECLPKYRMSSVLSVVVMVSAFLLLYTQKISWTDAYAFNGEAYAVKEGADLFTNGYRYLNWLIDVPMLLIQILWVAQITGSQRSSYMTKFSFSGCLMILTGYVGQFYEPGRINEDVMMWAVWGLISTGFFLHVLVLIKRVINDGASRMSGKAKSVFSAILPLFLISWWLYPIYTIADVASKVVYGAMLTVTATLLSQQEDPATFGADASAN